MDTTTHRHPLDPIALDVLGDRSTGQLGEDLAVRHLVVEDGLEVVARNWRLAAGELRGELDVVAVDHARGVVVVCEVKARRDAARFGGALAAVTPRKLSKVRTLTTAFLRTGGLPYRQVRIDVVAVDLGDHPVLHHVLDVR
jgi:putative endonuclease